MCIYKRTELINVKINRMEEDIYNIVPIISDGTIAPLKDFYHDTEIHLDNCSLTHLKKEQVHQGAAVLLSQKQTIIRELEELVSKNSTCINKLQAEIEELTRQKKSLTETVVIKEENIQKLQVEYKSLENKKKNLSEKRDKIQVCKLLTNTKFVLPSGNVTGYTCCPETQNIKPFDYSTKKMTPKEITSLLYDNIISLSSRPRTPDNID